MAGSSSKRNISSELRPDAALFQPQTTPIRLEGPSPLAAPTPDPLDAQVAANLPTLFANLNLFESGAKLFAEEELKKVNTQLQMTEKKLGDAQQAAVTIHQQLEYTQNQFQVTRQTTLMLRQQLESALKQLHTERQSSATLRQVLEVATKANREYKHFTEQLMDEKNGLLAQQDQLKADFAQKEETAFKEALSNTQKISQLKLDLETKDQQIATLEHRLKDKIDQASKIEDTWLAREQEVLTLRQDLRKKDEQISSLQHDLEVRDQQIVTLQSDLKTLSSRNEALTAANAKLEAQIQRTEQQINHLKAQLEKTAAKKRNKNPHRKHDSKDSRAATTQPKKQDSRDARAASGTGVVKSLSGLIASVKSTPASTSATPHKTPTSYAAAVSSGIDTSVAATTTGQGLKSRRQHHH